MPAAKCRTPLPRAQSDHDLREHRSNEAGGALFLPSEYLIEVIIKVNFD
jgi:hypothetical protein